MSSIVNEFSNVTNPVIEKILHLYSVFGSSIYKIQEELKNGYNVDISHQTIERVLLNFNFIKKHEPWTLSGYYLFDSLWVKIGGKWKYILALFDVKLNTIVSFDLVDSENSKAIYDFINKSTRNQPKKSVTTDLKNEYREIISRLGFKHQFCHFHTKQMINRNIRDYIKENKSDEDDIKLPKTEIEINERIEKFSKNKNNLFMNNLQEKDIEDSDSKENTIYSYTREKLVYEWFVQELLKLKIFIIYILDIKLYPSNNLIFKKLNNKTTKDIKKDKINKIKRNIFSYIFPEKSNKYFFCRYSKEDSKKSQSEFEKVIFE